MIGGVVNAVVDTGVRLLTGQEVSLKTIGSSFVEGCVVSATGSAAAKLVGKAVGAVKNTKTAAKITSATSKVKDKTAGLASKAIEKVKASRAASKVNATIKKVQTARAKTNNRVVKSVRTGSAVKSDKYHSFSNIVDNYAGYSKKFRIRGGDGVKRQLYQLKGSYNGKKGIFEWIIDPNPLKGVTHRRFIPGGRITGRPNQR